MSLNHVILSGRVSKPPKRVQQEDGRIVYVFPLAIRSPRMAFPIIAVEGTLPHFVTYYGERPLTDQPIISLVGARIVTRNLTFTVEEVTRMIRKAGVDDDVVEQISRILPDSLRINRVVTEILATPENVLPGGVW